MDAKFLKSFAVSVKLSNNDVLNFSKSLFLTLLVSFALGAWLNTYSMNVWLHHFSPDHSPVPWILGGLLAIVPGIGKYTIHVGLLTFIASFFL